MDRINDALGRSVFHADAVADYGAMFPGTGHGFIELLPTLRTPACWSTRQV